MRSVEFSEYGPASVIRVSDAESPHAGAGEIRVAVHASGVSPGEVRLRSGALRDLMPAVFPFRTGFDAAGVVDEVGPGAQALLGDEVFGMADFAVRGANADFAVLAAWAPKPCSWSWAEAGGAAGAVETAARVLDILALSEGQTVLVHGAAGGTGSVLVQVALSRGATVIGTASESNHTFLEDLGVIPTTYGDGMVARVRALSPDGVDAVVDCAGGALADLVSIAGDPARVVTIADFDAAAHGVRMTNGGTDPLAVHGLALAVALANAGELRIPVAATFPLDEIAAAHELIETRHARGKVVLLH